MAKLERKKFKVFAENAPLDEMGQFGSAVATTKKNTKDIEEIQELEAWQQGWGGAVISNKNYPPMEEMNGALNVMSYQTAYTLQEGVPEWNKDTVYYIGSIVKTLVDNKVVLYQSLKNENIGNVLDNSEYWEKLSLGGGLEICDIGMALYVDETKGLRRYLNGQVVNINANTKAFLNRLKQITTLHPSLLCTEEEWQTAKTMSAFGQVGKFVFNYSGDEIVSVRLPRVVNVQGLFDLQNLGMTISAGLPDHNHTYMTVNTSSTPRGDDRGGCYNSTVNLVSSNASRNNPIYGNSDTVQPEAIQYPYFIQIATGSETENNIINEIELNNPYSLFDSKYSDHELNNLSWLKSEGQWNSKAAYPDAYDKLLKVYNGTETVEGLSVKLSTETYTDYDFVLNTADETFRLPLLDGSEDLPSAKNYIYELPTSKNQQYTALYNGIIQLNAISSAPNQYVALINITTGEYDEMRTSISNVGNVCNIQVKAGDTFTVNGDNISTINWLANIKYTGNGSLYYYVGETVQNANLIDAGRLGEQLATKTDMLQASGAGMPSSKHIDLTVGASGSDYTAPANGWFYAFANSNEATHKQILLHNLTTDIFSDSYNAAGWAMVCYVPCQKGDVVKHLYQLSSGAFANNILKFIYAEGDK